jgi:Protein of unknown function (DUF3224)
MTGIRARMDRMTTTAIITITGTSWQEARYDEPDASAALAQADYTTTMSGDLVGASRGRFLLTYTGGDPARPESLEAEYCGYERVTGSLAGRSGSFVFDTRGAHQDGKASTSVRVVAGSGTGELAGLRGEGAYVADAMEYTLTLSYDLD